MFCTSNSVALAAILLWAVPALPAVTSITGARSVTVTVDAGGAYDVTVPATAWRFGGSTGAPLYRVATATGNDALDAYSEISFDYMAETPRHATIRAYRNRPVVLFSYTCLDSGPNSSGFPVFTRYPRGAQHINFAGMFAFPTFYGYTPESPWVFFDSTANTYIVSPAANFMVAATSFGRDEAIVSGISPAIPSLPQGFTHQVMLVMENGINRAFEAWGGALLDLRGKTPPANDADRSLKYLGYWTDAGASYYYRRAPSMSYPDTLTAVKAEFAAKGIALGYMQLDSWFYGKGAGDNWNDSSGGIYSYAAAPSLFPDGMAAFRKDLGIPLITHARWIDPQSPYRRQYRISGNVAVDPLYWNQIGSYLAASGVTTYEQDWLFNNAQAEFNLTDPVAFLDSMAAAMARNNVTMQYCMATARHMLQATHYPNLTTARVSADRFNRERWPLFLYASRFASALGIYPFTDVFMSAETDNLLLAVLSAGPVGLGDELGTVNAGNLLRAAREDGVIVKPDAPLVPVDASYLSDSRSLKAPLVAATYSDFGALRTGYVFAFTQGEDTVAAFRPVDAGVRGPAYVYDYFAGSGRLAESNETVSAIATDGRAYFVVAPVGPSGIAMLGDTGHFVPMGRKRVADFTDDGAVRLTVTFSAGEAARTLQGYAPFVPEAASAAGLAGAVTYDPSTQRFALTVSPGRGGTATICLAAPRRAEGAGTLRCAE